METTTVTETLYQNITDTTYHIFNTTINTINDDTVFTTINNFTDPIFNSTTNDEIFNSTFNDIIFNSTFNDTNFSTINNGTNGTSNRPGSDFAKYFPLIMAEMALSCLCLIFSIAVYAVLPEFKNVHGKNLISMSVSLLVTFILLICDLMWRNSVSRAVCFNIAMVIHVTFLANFFWTNVMAFDIWKSLTDMKAKGEVKGNNVFNFYLSTLKCIFIFFIFILDSN